MVIERNNNELIIRISSSLSTQKMQELIDYLRYAEIAEKSKATKQDLDTLLTTVKKSRKRKVSA